MAFEMVADEKESLFALILRKAEVMETETVEVSGYHITRVRVVWNAQGYDTWASGYCLHHGGNTQWAEVQAKRDACVRLYREIVREE